MHKQFAVQKLQMTITKHMKKMLKFTNSSGKCKLK